jgi:5-methylcytosine-specific restriction endonuclease McrA
MLGGVCYPSLYADHIIEVTDDTSDANFFNEANVQSLCARCHRRKTDAEAAKRAGRRPPQYRRPLIVGCDADGMPLDPDH